MKHQSINVSIVTSNSNKEQMLEKTIINAISTYFDASHSQSKLSDEERNIYNAVLKYFMYI